MTLVFTFWLCVVIFGVVGAMRGWAKELLVTFSIVLALFLLEVLSRYLPPVRDFFASDQNQVAKFWVRTIILLFLVFFGYQTPNIARMIAPRLARERLADSLLGIFLGALNGYLIVGTLWWFMIDSGYPFPKYITKPTPDPNILAYLPPEMLGIPRVYFAMALSFLFVLVVFI